MGQPAARVGDQTEPRHAARARPRLPDRADRRQAGLARAAATPMPARCRRPQAACRRRRRHGQHDRADRRPAGRAQGDQVVEAGAPNADRDGRADGADRRLTMDTRRPARLPRRRLGYPVGIDPRTGDSRCRATSATSSEAIRIILETAPGERVMRPHFGCGIHDLVFEEINATTLAAVEASVREALIDLRAADRADRCRRRSARRARRPARHLDRLSAAAHQPGGQSRLSLLLREGGERMKTRRSWTGAAPASSRRSCAAAPSRC